MTFKNDLSSEDFHPYYTRYVNYFKDSDTIFSVLETGLISSTNFLTNISQDLSYRYDAKKWNIGQVIQHCIDTERIFAYRALRFLRGDSGTMLSGFDQDLFTRDFKEFAFAKADLLNELHTTRAATLQLYKNAPEVFLTRAGTANGNNLTARAIPFIVAGHYKHHENVITQRYL